MSKKSRKARAKGRIEPIAPVASRPQPKVQASAQAASKQPVVTAAAAFQARSYDYVKSDLVRIAIIAGSLILILIILTFIPALKS
jgi:predicted RND superfamily exporter protein